MVTSPVASRYTGVLRALVVNLKVALEATVIVMQLNMPSDGRGKVVLVVMFIGPYVPSLPDWNVNWPQEFTTPKPPSRPARSAQRIVRGSCMVFIVCLFLLLIGSCFQKDIDMAFLPELGRGTRRASWCD
jgi:hypothetical protein